MKHPRISKSSAVGFTLVELLTVIAIIAILAGLVLSTAGYAQKKGARSRAEAEIAAMEAALESYKADNGAYPEANSISFSSGNYVLTPSSYKSASLVLYKALSGDNNLDRKTDEVTPPTNPKSYLKTYFEFKPGMLELSSGNGTVTAIIDPFGNSYGYSTAYSSSNGTSGFNPTFDLWSTNGESSTTPKVGVVGWTKNW